MSRPSRWFPIVALGLAILLGPAAVLAHGGEEEAGDALDLTNQAIAFLRAEPPDLAAATERLDDALQAEEAPDDVDLRLVEAAGIEGEPLGPVVTVTITPGTYVALAVAALLVGLGAFGLGVRRGRRGRPSASTGAAHD